jgi:tRNA pseudouridine55 synthase
VLPLADAVAAAFPVRRLDDGEALALSHGRRLAPTGTAATVGAFAPDGRCVALLEDRGGAARPTVVFAPGGG